MTKDNRDPVVLGHKLLNMTLPIADGQPRPPLSEIADHAPLHAPDYPDETTLDKYGDPREIPHD